jgi:small-conductance mechanosensitive channel
MSILGPLIDLVAGTAQVLADAFAAFRPGRGERPRAATRPVLVLRLIVFAPASYVFASLAWFLYAGLDLARAHFVTYGLFAAATLFAACLALALAYHAIRTAWRLLTGDVDEADARESAPTRESRIEAARARARARRLARPGEPVASEPGEEAGVSTRDTTPAAPHRDER